MWIILMETWRMLATLTRGKKTNTKALQIAIFMAYTDDVQFFCKCFWALKCSFGVSNHSAESYCPVLQKMRHKKWNGLLKNKAEQVNSCTTGPCLHCQVILCHMLTAVCLSWRNCRASQIKGLLFQIRTWGTLVLLFVSMQPTQKVLEPPCTTGSSKSSSLRSVRSNTHSHPRDGKSKHSWVAHTLTARQTPAIMAANAGFLQSQDLAVVGLNDCSNHCWAAGRDKKS